MSSTTPLYLCHRNLLPSSSIQHAVHASFISAFDTNFIVSKSCSLDVYTARKCQGSSLLELTGSFPLEGNVVDLLPLRAPAALDNEAPSADWLVLVFQEAKFVVVRYEPTFGKLETVAIHNFEDNASAPGSVLGGAEGSLSPTTPITAVDPAGMCIAMLAYGHKLVILPTAFGRNRDQATAFTPEERRAHAQVFWGDAESAQQVVGAAESGGASSSSLGGSMAFKDPFVVDLHSCSMGSLGPSAIRALSFLEGYSEPTLAILHEAQPRCALRLAKQPGECELVVLSLCLAHRRHPVLWRVQHLPHDCSQLCQVPVPVQGVLVISPNAIIHLGQNSHVRLSTLGLNGFAPATYGGMIAKGDSQTQSTNKDVSETNKRPLASGLVPADPNHLAEAFVLEGARLAFVHRQAALLTVKTGKAYILYLDRTRNNSGADKVQMSAWAVAQIDGWPSALAVAPRQRLVLICNRDGDTLMAHLELGSAAKVVPEQDDLASVLRSKRKYEDGLTSLHSDPKKKKQHKDSEIAKDRAQMNGKENIAWDNIQVNSDNEEEFLYGPVAKSALERELEDNISSPPDKPGLRVTALTIVDSLPCSAPLVHGAIGDIYTGPAGPTLESTNPFAGDANTLRVSHLVLGSGQGFQICSPGLIPRFMEKTKLPGCENIWWVGEESNAFLLASCPKEERTIIMRLAQHPKSDSVLMLQEISEDDDSNPFLVAVHTVTCGKMAKGRLTLQVYTQGIRVVLEGQALQDILLLDDIDTGGLQGGEDTRIISGDFEDKKGILKLSDGSLRFLYLDDEDFDVLASLPEYEYCHTATSMCLFEGKENLFLSDDIKMQASMKLKRQISRLSSVIQTAEDYDEEDAFLYHDLSTKATDLWDHTQGVDGKSENSDDSALVNDASSLQHYYTLIDEGGNLRIMEMTSGRVCFSHRGTTFGPPILVNTPIISKPTMPPWVSDEKDSIKDKLTAHVLDSKPTQNEAREKALFDELTETYHYSEQQIFDLKNYFSEEQKYRENEQRFESNSQAPKSSEMCITTIGLNGAESWSKRFCLVILLEKGEILVYTARFYKERLSCWIKTEHHFLSQQIPSMGPRISSHLFHFQEMGGHSGVAVGGWRPAIILCQRGRVGVFPLHPNSAAAKAPSSSSSSAIHAFSSLSHGALGSGCAVCFEGGEVAVYAADGALHFDASGASGYTAFKVNLGRKVHKICYLGDGKDTILAKVLSTPTYALLTSTKTEEQKVQTEYEAKKAEKEQTKQQRQAEDDEYKEEDIVTDWVEADPTFGGVPKTYTDAFQIEMVSSNGWQTLWNLNLDPFEHGLAMLFSTLGKKKRKLLIVGTGFTAPEGEDEICLGNLLFFELDLASYMDPDRPGGVRQAPKLKKLDISKEEKGPVSALAQLGKDLIVAVGPKLVVYQLTEDVGMVLNRIGFWDAQVYVVHLSTVHSKENFLVLVGDYCRNISFLIWKDDDSHFREDEKNQLNELAKAYRPGQTMGASFVFDPPSLGMLVSDYDRNIQMFQYSKVVEARGGNKLLCKADFHLGSIATFFLQHKAKTSVLQHRHGKKSQRNRFSLIFGTIDGGVGAFVPVEERVFRRLYALQGVMINAVQHNAALNPRAFRLFVSLGFHDGRKKNVINGALVWRFVYLDARFQTRLASAIGTTVGTIISNLLEIELSTPLGFYN